MNKIWVNKANSFEEAEKFDRDYYLKMTSSERVEIVQFLREIFKKRKNGDRKGLRGFIKVIK